jgi:predicted chitinase
VPVLSYAKNIGRSTAYALPQILKNRIPNVHALVEQLTDKGQRENTVNAAHEIRSIIKEDVFGLMKKGLDNAQREIRTGKLYQTEEETSASYNESFNIDESMLDNSFLDGIPDEGGQSATASVAASAAAAGAAQGVMSAAARLGDSPSARAGAEASMATARFSRANLGAQLAIGNALRGAVMANAQILGDIHRFQTSVQQSFYHKQLEHNQAMATMTSELISKIAELKEVSTVAASATDQVMAAFTGKESDFNKVFGSGNFQATAYLNVMAGRFKRAVGDGSMFKMAATQMASAPLAKGFQMALEGLIPKDFGKQLEQFNQFVGGLGQMLNERARNYAKRNQGGLASKLVNFFSIEPESMSKGPDLSRIVRGKAVAFDGYAHRSLVEVIPSHLADIHSELVAMRRAKGVADPTDRKLYDFKTGRFTSEKGLRDRFEKDIERRSMSSFDGVRKTIGDGGDKQTAKDIHAALRVLGKEQFSINKGSAEDFGAQIDMEADRLERSGRKDDAQRLRAGKHHLVRARKQYGSRFASNLQRSIGDYNTSHARSYESISSEEGAHRMMYSGQVEGGLSIAAAPGGRIGRKGQRGNAGGVAAPSMDDDIFAYGEGTGYQTGKSGSIFRDDSGKVTFKSILAAPMNAVSKAMNAFETKVSDVFFGDSEGKKGVFSKISESLFGTSVTGEDGKTVREGGLFGGMINTFNSKVFDPLKRAIVGDPRDPSSKDKSLVGTMKRWFGEAVASGKSFLFGKQTDDGAGGMVREGGLFGGVVNWFSGKSKQLKEYLLGKGGDGEQPGLLTGLKEKFDRMVERVQKSLFGTVGEDGRRAGGAFGDQIQKGKDFLKGLWDRFQETAVKPLGQALFGTVGADGKRAGGAFGNAFQKGKDFLGKLWGDTQNFVLAPMKKALFGKGVALDDGFGNVTYKDRGILPTLGDTIKASIINPMAKALFGDKQVVGKDAQGNPIMKRQGGALGQIWTSMKEAFAPLKETFVGKDGIWTNMKKGLSDTFRDLKVSLFGGKKGEPDKPFMERIGEKISDGIKKVGDWLQNALKPVTGWIEKGGEWLRTKVFEPFNTWLTDPKTGFITRMRDGAAKFFYGEKGDDGVRKGGLFGSVKDTMNRFFYGDSEKGTKGFVERAVEPAKKFVLEEIWEPLKKNVGEMWDNTKTFFKEEIFKPLSGVLQPFVTEAKEQWRLMKEWIKGPLFDSIKGIGAQLNDSMKGVFGKSFTDMMRDNVLNPIKDALSGVRQFLGNTLKAVFKFPVNVLKGASDELAMSQIRRGVFKGSEQERERLMGKMGAKEDDVPAGQGSSIGAAQPKVKAGGSVTESGGTAEKEQKTFWQKAKEAFTGKKGSAADAAASTAVSNASAPGAAKADGTKAGGSATAATSQSQQSAPGAAGQPTRAEQANADAAKGGSSVRGAGSKYDPIRLAQATADNTHNIYQFMTKHMWGVGKNVERIVKHFKIKDTALGGNTSDAAPSGFLGKLRKLITNPISFIKDTIAGAFDFVKNVGKRLFEAAKNVVMVPVKLMGKALSTATKVITSTVKAIAPLAGVLKDALVGTLTAAVKVTATVFKESAKAVGTVVSSIAKAIPDVANALASATVGILKAGGQLALGAAKIAGSLATTLMEIGGKMIATATKVAKDVVTGLARVTFDAIGSAFNMITGRGKGGGSMGKLTPVFVTGGFLAGTEGGAKTLAEAQAMTGGGARRLAAAAVGAGAGAMTGVGALLGAGLGFFSPEIAERIQEGKTTLRQGMKRAKERMKAPFQALSAGMKAAKDKSKAALGTIKSGVTGAIDGMHLDMTDARDSAAGGWQAVRDRGSKMASAIKEVKWKDKLLSASEKTTNHLAGIRTGFSKFGSLMMAILPMVGSGIMALVNYFKKGEFLGTLAKLLGKEGMIGKVGSLARGAKNLGTKAMKGLGGLKGVGITAAAGIGGPLVKDWADDNMEDGLGKTAVKTGGSMLEYGAMGATIGSVIPGVGTAVGAGVGAAVGAAVENWDSIVDSAKGMWEVTKKAGRTIKEAAGTLADMTKNVGKAIYSHFFGNDVEIDPKTGKVVRQEKANILGRMWETLVGTDEKVLKDGQVVKEGGIGILGNIKNFGLNAVGVFGKMLSGKDWEAGDFVKGTVLEGITTKIEDGLKSFIDGMVSIKNGLVDGFKYVTEMRFVDDIKKAVTNWWNGEDETQKKQEGGSEFVGPMDNRSWYQKLGDKMTGWADDNRAKVNTVTVGQNGQPIANRAFGGKLGRNGTLVGEIGPELLDANGNVIPMGKMQSPGLGAAAQQREGSISSILQDTQKNSFYATNLLQSINQALGGMPVTAVKGANDPVFDPKRAQAATSKRPGLFGMIANAFNMDPETGGKLAEAGGVLGGAVSDIAGHVGEAVSGTASSLYNGAKGAVSSALSGDFAGAGRSLKSGLSNAGNAIKAGASGVFQTIKGAGEGAVSAIRGDAGKNVEMLKSFMSNNGMTDPKEQAMFLAQLDHESGGFKVLSENLRYRPSQLLKTFPKYFKSIEEATAVAGGGPEAIANRVYGGRMGNKDDGDGFKFRGRGFIQLTGRDNYARAGKDLGLDLVSNPDLAAEPENAAKIALWYWNQRGIGGPARQGDIEKVTKLINGGSIGIEDRRSKYAKYLNVVGKQDTQVASSDKGSPVKTAMLGGFLSGVPTLVGERQPEILGPNGQIHRSVDAYLNSPNADVAGLAQSTAIKEAMRRAAGGADHGGANEALGKIASAAGALGGNSDELLKQMLAALQQIAGNTAPISQLAQAAGGNSTVNADTSQRSNTNVFALGQKPERSAGGMHPSMRRLVSGG